MDTMDAFRLAIADHLCVIEDVIAEWGLDNLTGLTLIARDPSDPIKMHIIFSNEDDEKYPEIAKLLTAERDDDGAAII